MSTIVLFWYLMCHEGVCERTSFEVSREAAAIIACESGNQYDLGSFDLQAKNPNSSASGLFQFIDGTYKGLTGKVKARTDSPENQYKAFKSLWEDGKGWYHWNASKACWSQWMYVNDKGVAVWR